MPLLKHAWTCVVSHPKPCVLYIVLNVIAGGMYHFGELAVKGFIPETQTPPWAFAYSIGMDILLAALSSVFQAVFFAQLGKEIDRPLWKCADARTALNRFWLPWFIINLVFITVFRLQWRFAQSDSGDSVLIFEFAILLLYLFAIPVGTCIMHWGRLDWTELGDALSPMAKHFPLLLAVLGLNFFQWMLHLMVGFSLPESQSWGLAPLLALVNAPFALLDCVAFAATWQICMIHRNSSPVPEYSDLDR